MRLTLRTLLAWLDDTLTPSEVREIGKQVADSSFAGDLVQRIHKVTRQRRLTVPPRTGADAVDPNIVASYLDNELDPDAVAELEKRCLTSDLHLAEVASVHQILSLIGQRAKVPVEARHRMYHLIKGRESVGALAPRASKQTEPQPISEPVQPWISPPPPRRPWIERFVPVGAVLGLMLMLCWSAWRTLTPLADLGPRISPKMPVTDPTAVVAVKRPEPIPNDPAALKAAEADAAKKAQARLTTADAAFVAIAKASETAKAKPASDVPAGAVGLARKPAGLLLRFNSERRDWDRVTEATPLREQDRLLSLAPFRSVVEIGTADIDMVGETEIWARGTMPTHAARFSLAQGRIVLHATTPSLPFELQNNGKAVTITPPPGATFGLERINRRVMGEPTASGSALKIFTVEGPVKVSVAGIEETLEGAGEVTIEPDGTLTGKVAKANPAWVSESSLTPFDQKIGEQFLKFFRPDRPIVSSLVEATEDDQKDVCRLAISALRAVGDISYITPLLNKQGDPTAPTARRAAILVLRSYLAQGPESAKTLREQLRRDFGDGLAPTAEKLLTGYTPKEAADPATLDKLVGFLSPIEDTEVGLRELALDNLMQITGRDSLDYDPEKPLGKGLRAWQDLFRLNELKPAASKKASR